MIRNRVSSLGLESGVVRLAPYDPAWPRLYAAEAGRLLDALARHGVSLTLEHTGSTAIPGLAAKPIVDILAGLRNEDDRPSAIQAIVDAGYIHRGEQEIPGRDFFRRGDPRQYHVHLTVIGNAFWDDHRTFRDYLLSHPETARAYAELKRDLAARYPRDRESYILGKTDFVLDTLARACGTGV